MKICSGKTELYFTCGRNVYDFFVLPAIRLYDNGFGIYLTIDWLCWFVGIKFYSD